jgi:hypothetical protein
VSILQQIIAWFRSLLGIKPAEPRDAVVIDQAAYYDSLERRQKEWRESERIIAKERELVARSVWSWACGNVSDRCKRPLPPGLPRNSDLREWMNGLNVKEIFAISQSDSFAVWNHIYSDNLIEGVREVQPLPEAILRFPPRAPVVDERFSASGGGGGPRRRR